MSAILHSGSHQEQQSFSHQNARLTFHHESFTDSLSVGRTRRQVVITLSFLLLLTLSCALACLVYLTILIEHNNHHAAAWAFLSVAVSVGMSTLFALHLRTKLEDWHDRRSLEGIKIFGMLMGVTAGLASGIYIILGFINMSGFSLEGQNYFSATLFSLICLAVSLGVYFTAQWYQNAIQFAEATRAVDMENIVQPAEEAITVAKSTAPDSFPAPT